MLINKIGIALAAYQPRVDYFAEQLRSIQQQKFKNWICVISFDSPLREVGCHEMMQPFVEDQRFLWFENLVRLGHKKNFEWAIQRVLQEGVDAIACSDQDDVWSPHKLTVTAKALEKAGPMSLVHSDMEGMDETGSRTVMSIWKVENRGIHQAKTGHLLVRNIVAGCSMLLDAELARRYPTIPEGVQFHDHWYALVASRYGGVHAVDEALYGYRQHGKNVVGVTPFQGVFSWPPDVRWKALFGKCRNSWQRCSGLARTALDVGLPLSFSHRWIFIQQKDLGLSFFLWGFFQLFQDRPFARACFAIGVGKFLHEARN